MASSATAGPAKKRRLGELASTAICGNDITSSCLYVSALAILHAGIWAPLSLLLVSGVLYLFRSIYAEVVGALPLNGGAYNALLNTTSKTRASVAACLTILSYMATAVISANEAMNYVHSLWAGLPVIGATIGLLAVFAVLTIIGITESARVAVAIFVVHLSTLGLLILAGIVYLLGQGPAVLAHNLRMPSTQGLLPALFFGFSAAMLGISGFESSANFVEEQQPGVFPKTLRNMWAAVTILNPGIALLALALIPLGQVAQHQEALLAHMAQQVGHTWLAILIAVDAALVLSGAVLTSFVGVNGLVYRMTLDRCLPQLLLKRNRRHTTHRIVIAFFVMAVSVLLITEGRLEALAGVYTISFLSVMILFAVGNVLLKIKRARLPRPSQASWSAVTVAIAAVGLGLLGNALMNPPYVRIFLEYFLPAMLVIGVMLSRIALLKACLFVVHGVSDRLSQFMTHINDDIVAKIDQINAQEVVFFTRGDSVANLNQALLYVQKNEHTNRVKVVTVFQDPKDVPENLARDIALLNEEYPEVEIDLVEVQGRFGPELISRLSRDWAIPTNFMFIGSPGPHFPFSLMDLGGVRLII